MNHRFPPALRFVAWPALAMLAVFGVLFAATVWLVDRDNDEAARIRVEQRALVLTDRLQSQMRFRLLEIRQLAAKVSLERLEDTVRLRGELEWLQRESPAFAWIGVVSPEGRVLAGTRGWLEGQSIAARPVFAQGRERPYVGDFHPAVVLARYMAPEGGPPPSFVDIGVPIVAPDGRPLGVLAGHIDKRWVDELAARTVTPLESRALGFRWGLLDDRGRSVGPALPFELPAGARAPAAPRSFETRGGDVDWWLGTTRAVIGPPDRPLTWTVVVALDQRKASALLTPLITTLGVVTLLAAAGAALAGYLVSRRMTRPYDRLLRAVSDRYRGVAGGQPVAFDQFVEGLGAELEGRNHAEVDPEWRFIVRLARDMEELKALIDRLPMAIAVVDADGRVAFANEGLAALFGIPREQLQDLPLHARLPLVARHRDTAWSAPEDVRRDDGRRLRVRVRELPLPATGGHPEERAVVIEDVTPEADAQDRLQESEQRLAAIVGGATDAIVSVDVDGRIQLVNPAAERIFGVPAAELLGEPLDRLLPAAARGTHLAHLRRFAASGVSQRPMGVGLVEGVTADGRRLDLEASISQVTVHGDQVLTAILRDVTDRVASERERAEQRAQLASLARRLMVQEKETTARLAQSLHDDLGQTLTALRMLVEAAAPAPVPSGDRRALPAERLARLVADANLQVRRVLVDLRPPLLDELGLAAALDNEVRQRQADAPDVAVQLRVPASATRWPADVEYAAFMVGREALGNALQHARPRHVVVELEGTEGRLGLRVYDDGTGVAGLDGLARPGHLGLVGMRERAAAAGATLSIDSSASLGTEVTFEWTARPAA